MNMRAFLPLRYCLWVCIIALGQLRYTFLTLLDRATHHHCRAGASVEYLSHKASRDGELIYRTPSRPGTKHIVSVLRLITFRLCCGEGLQQVFGTPFIQTPHQPFAPHGRFLPAPCKTPGIRRRHRCGGGRVYLAGLLCRG